MTAPIHGSLQTKLREDVAVKTKDLNETLATYNKSLDKLNLNVGQRFLSWIGVPKYRQKSQDRQQLMKNTYPIIERKMADLRKAFQVAKKWNAL